MKRLTLLATAVVGLALGAAACSDSPVQPTEPTAGLATDVSPSLGIFPNRFDACSVFLPSELCTRPRATLCDAFVDGGEFAVKNRKREIVATIIIDPNGEGAEVRIEAPGRRTVKFQVSARAIHRLCPGGSGGGGGDD